jgi:IS30 family transposase
MDTILNIVKKMEGKTVTNSFTSDLGSEFNNSKFKSFCEKENISTYYAR